MLLNLLKFKAMKKIREHAAGIDIGANNFFVSIDGEEVKVFFTYTDDIKLLRNYLLENKIETVAMEATGVYWVVLYEMLEEAGFDVWLIDGRETKQVPGRKTDVKDCQWIQQLHSYGLLNRCYVSDSDTKELKSYVRLREDHIRSASMHINHMQKALTQMNIRLKEVLSQIHGKSGLAIIKAILEGERDRDKLVDLCHVSILKKKRDLVYKALEGNYTKSGLFALKQAFQGYMFYQQQIDECDIMINSIINKLGNNGENPKVKEKPQKEVKRKRIRHNSPKVDNLGQNLLNIFGGKDATKISGITDYTWLQLYSETGSDLSRWPSEKHFTSWLGLSPGQNHSGKKRRNAKKKGHPPVGQIFRTIAQSLINSKYTALGSFGRRLRARKGSSIAIKATARKLAELYWRVMVKGLDYAEMGVKKYEEQLQVQKMKIFKKMAKDLNVLIT